MTFVNMIIYVIEHVDILRYLRLIIFDASFNAIRLIDIVERTRYIMHPFNAPVCLYIDVERRCYSAFSHNVGKVDESWADWFDEWYQSVDYPTYLLILLFIPLSRFICWRRLFLRAFVWDASEVIRQQSRACLRICQIFLKSLIGFLKTTWHRVVSASHAIVLLHLVFFFKSVFEEFASASEKCDLNIWLVCFFVYFLHQKDMKPWCNRRPRNRFRTFASEEEPRHEPPWNEPVTVILYDARRPAATPSSRGASPRSGSAHGTSAACGALAVFAPLAEAPCRAALQPAAFTESAASGSAVCDNAASVSPIAVAPTAARRERQPQKRRRRHHHLISFHLPPPPRRRAVSSSAARGNEVSGRSAATAAIGGVVAHVSFVLVVALEAAQVVCLFQA